METLIRLFENSGAHDWIFPSFLEDYKEHLAAPPATWKHLVVSFQNYLGKPETQERISDQRRHDEWRRAEEREMNTPIPVQKAFQLLQFKAGHSPRAPLSEVDEFVLGRLEREGVTEIAPQDLLGLQSFWEKRRCKACGYSGRVGSALNGTLRLCECEHGADLESRNGHALLKAEVIRVNSSLHDKLLEACKELQLTFSEGALADGIAEEIGETIRVTTDKAFRWGLKPQDFRRALEKIGLTDKTVRLEFVPTKPDAHWMRRFTKT